jgi:predicted NBD/HSP70 family sugar kinase
VTQRNGVTTGRDTTGMIFDLIRSAGTVSRVELAGRSGLTEASVSRIVKQLLADGVVAETGRGVSTGGKRPTLLELNASSRHAIGVFLSDTRISFVLTDLAGRIVVSTESEGIAHETRSAVVTRMARDLETLIDDAGVNRSNVLGVGVATPGRREISGYLTRAHPLDYAEWAWHAIEQDLADATGMRITVENDSTCAAIGEFWISRAPAASHFAVLNMAHGFGVGLVTSGDVYRGSTSNVGEIGHMVLDVDGPECPCGSRGCLELLASPLRIADKARHVDGLADRLGISRASNDNWEDYERIANAAMEGDTDALALIEASARILGAALVSLTNVLDLDHVVLTGPGFDIAGPIYARVVADELDRLAFVRNVHATAVRLSESAKDSSALGAATLVIHQQLGGFRRGPGIAGDLPTPAAVPST